MPPKAPPPFDFANLPKMQHTHQLLIPVEHVFFWDNAQDKAAGQHPTVRRVTKMLCPCGMVAEMEHPDKEEAK